MLILYNKAARKNLSKPKEAAKWYPVLRSTGMLKEREVPKLIADKTTLNPKEAIARIEFKDVEVLTCQSLSKYCYKGTGLRCIITLLLFWTKQAQVVSSTI